MDIFIIRHGESEENAGTSTSDDAALTPRGREQARRTGQWFAESELRPQCLFISPALRTLETAHFIRKTLPVAAVVDPDLCEKGLLYESPGLSGDEIRARFDSPEGAPGGTEPGGTEQTQGLLLPEDFPRSTGWAGNTSDETKSEFVERAHRVLQRYVTEYAARFSAIGLVTHAHFAGFLLGALLDIPTHLISKRRLRHLNCGVTRIMCTEAYRLIHFMNATSHLGDLVVPE